MTADDSAPATRVVTWQSSAPAESAAGESGAPLTREGEPGGTRLGSAPDTPGAVDVRSTMEHDAAPGPGPGIGSDGDREAENVALLHLATRLKAAHPTVEASVVEDTVAAAHDAFREAKIRTYVPILVERRARNLLGAMDRERTTSPAPAPVLDPAPAPAPTPAPEMPPCVSRHEWSPADG